jgi:hypothetical protein
MHCRHAAFFAADFVIILGPEREEGREREREREGEIERERERERERQAGTVTEGVR